MDRIQRLSEEKIGKLVLQFSWPAVIMLVAGALYGVIDRIFIGESVGDLGIAGITVAFPIVFLLYASSSLIGVGGAALISMRLGAQKNDEAEEIVGNGLLLLIIGSVVPTILAFIFLAPLLRAFGASNESLPFAQDYLRIVLLGAPFSVVSFGMNTYIIAEGNPRKAMMTIVSGPVLNIIFAPILLFGFRWGMKGAALATILSQIISAVWILSHFFSDKSVLKIRGEKLRLKFAVIGRIGALGATTFLLQILLGAINGLINTSAEKYGGDVAVSAMGVIFSIQVVIVLLLMGIGQGIQPIVGFNYGAKKFDRARAALIYALVVATSIGTLALIVTWLFSAQIFMLFNGQDQKLITFGSYAMGVVFISLPTLGIQTIATGYFQAIGKARNALLLGLSRRVLIFPALLILPLYMGMQGVLIAGPITDVIGFLLAGGWLLVGWRDITGAREVFTRGAGEQAEKG